MVVFANSQRCFDENSISRSKGRMTNGKIRSLSKKSMESVSQYFSSSWKKVLVGEKGRLEGTIKPGYHARGERERGERGILATGARKDISRKKIQKKEAQWKKGALKSCFASLSQWPPEDVRAFTTHPTELLSDCVTQERPSISQHKLRREAIVSTTMYVSLFSLRGALNQTCHPLLSPPCKERNVLYSPNRRNNN